MLSYTNPKFSLKKAQKKRKDLNDVKEILENFKESRQNIH